MVLYETIHEMHRKKLIARILRMPMIKSIVFPLANLRTKGFSPLWCKRIDQIVHGESVGIKVNDEIRHYF